MHMQHTARAARDFLERTGLEPTLNRILVLSAVRSSDHPLTAREVLDAVLRQHRINRVTVYRILDLLADHGAVNRLTSGDRANLYCHGEDHCHFHCTGCGRVQCLAEDALHLDQQALGRSLGLNISHIDLHLEGLCPACSNQST